MIPEYMTSTQVACMTKFTREHFDGEKNPSNEPARAGLKKLKKEARAKWIANGRKKRN